VFRIEIDRSLCSGFGSCAALAPHSLVIGPDGLAAPTDPHTDEEAVVDAAASCPMGAIAVFLESGEPVA
jgi:ferredoxin